MNARTILNSMQSEAISGIDEIRRTHPFKSDFLISDMGTYAAHALDVIERQTGLEAPLDAILQTIEDHMEGRTRWARITGHRETFIIFRDLSMLTYREHADPADEENLSNEEIEACLEAETEQLGRTREFSEDEMLAGLLPVALTLDLGFHPSEPSGIILKLMVDRQNDEGNSLRLICRYGADESDLGVSPDIFDIGGPLRSALERAEELIEHARAAAVDLPEIRRPSSTDLQGIDICEFECNGIWSNAHVSYYWPPYLSRPTILGTDPSLTIQGFTELAELALWACPDLPEEMTFVLRASITTEHPPTFTYEFPAHMGAWEPETRSAKRALDIMRADFEDLFNKDSFDFAVGHTTGMKSSTSAGATGTPVETIEVTRPSARRALEIDQEYAHSFHSLKGFSDPQEAADIEETLLAQPHAFSFDIADHAGRAFVVKPDEEINRPKGLPSYTMAIAGGDNPNTMERLMARRVARGQMAGYEATPRVDEHTSSCSIAVGEQHDTELRRPLGFASVSTSMCTNSEDQVGGQLRGHDVTTYNLELYLDRIQPAEGTGPEARGTILCSVLMMLSSLLSRISDQGRVQNRHFEVDVTIGGAIEEWLESPVTEEDLGMIIQALKDVRKVLPGRDPGEFVSLRDVELASETPWA